MADKLTRRAFLQGIAAVAIAAKLAPAIPRLEDPVFKSTERFSYAWVDHRGVWASRIHSMIEATEQLYPNVAARVIRQQQDSAALASTPRLHACQSYEVEGFGLDSVPSGVEYKGPSFLTDPDAWWVKAECERMVEDHFPGNPPAYITPELLADYVAARMG